MKYLFYFHLTSRLNEFIINADSRTDTAKGRVNPAELKSSQNGFNRVSGNSEYEHFFWKENSMNRKVSGMAIGLLVGLAVTLLGSTAHGAFTYVLQNESGVQSKVDVPLSSWPATIDTNVWNTALSNASCTLTNNAGNLLSQVVVGSSGGYQAVITTKEKFNI